MAAITHMAHENLRMHACGPIHPGVATPRLFVILAVEKEQKAKIGDPRAKGCDEDLQRLHYIKIQCYYTIIFLKLTLFL